MEKIAVGQPAPDFTLAGINGEKFMLHFALANGPVVAAFFKISCPVCQYSFPFLERIYKAYRNARMSFWAISQDDPRDTTEFCQEFGISFPALLDTKGYPVSNLYGLTHVPTIFLIAPDGKVQFSTSGFSRVELEKISAELARHVRQPLFSVFRLGESVPDYKPG